MTTSTLGRKGRATVVDRVVRWALDPDGDSYGDERERLRWYEGIVAAAQVQWIALPWAATALVWILGKPAVLPLAVMMALVYLPIAGCLAYLHRRRVETAVRRWTPKRIALGLMGGAPYVLFMLSAVYAVTGWRSSIARGIAVGALIGVVAAIIGLIADTRRRRHREAAVVGDDE